jgi:tetratricopeptide (TPR) repeat protein
MGAITQSGGKMGLYSRWIAWKNRPPTDKETAQARVQLQLSAHLREQAIDAKHYDLALNHLAQATLALNKARRLDKNAKITLTTKSGPLEATQDWLAFDYLTLEGLVCERKGHAESDHPFTMDDDVREQRWRKSKRAFKQSIRAYEKAHKYNPQDPLPFIGIFDAYWALEGPKKKLARKYIKKALKLEPTNMDALSRWQKVNTGWRSFFSRY